MFKKLCEKCTFVQYKMYERSIFSVKMVYKRVIGWTLGGPNFVDRVPKGLRVPGLRHKKAGLQDKNFRARIIKLENAGLRAPHKISLDSGVRSRNFRAPGTPLPLGP